MWSQAFYDRCCRLFKEQGEGDLSSSLRSTGHHSHKPTRNDDDEGESDSQAMHSSGPLGGLRSGKPTAGIALPEAAGLPIDETFTFLSILKRCLHSLACF